MSVRVSTWAWKQPVGANAKLVLLALADQSNDQGQCWPRQSTLVAKCGLSERALRAHVESLESGGYIKRERRHRSDGTRTSDLYTLALPADFAGGTADYRQISPRLSADLAKPTGKSRRSLIKAVEPSSEPSGEPGVLPPKNSRDFSRFDRVVKRG